MNPAPYSACGRFDVTEARYFLIILADQGHEISPRSNDELLISVKRPVDHEVLARVDFACDSDNFVFSSLEMAIHARPHLGIVHNLLEVHGQASNHFVSIGRLHAWFSIGNFFQGCHKFLES
jgi:hypothetical protein